MESNNNLPGDFEVTASVHSYGYQKAEEEKSSDSWLSIHNASTASLVEEQSESMLYKKSSVFTIEDEFHDPNAPGASNYQALDSFMY